MICDFCFAIIPDTLEEVPEPMKLNPVTEKMCMECLVVFKKKPWLLDENWKHVCRAIGCNHLTEEDVNVLSNQYEEKIYGRNRTAGRRTSKSKGGTTRSTRRNNKTASKEKRGSQSCSS